MAIEIESTQPRTTGGRTSAQIADSFIIIQTAGAREFAKQLEVMALRAGQDPGGLRAAAVKHAAKIIEDGYKSRVHEVTGNLQKSVTTKIKQYEGATVGIVGPRVTGAVGANQETGSGNHSWLLEFGTGPRKPGSQGRRTYVSVHQAINGKMRRAGTFNNEQFERMGRGYYFLMGSINERTRQRRKGSGYPHDFGSYQPGEMFPVFLKPGESLAPMPAKAPMQKTISESSSAVLKALIDNMKNYIQTLS